MTIGDRVTYRDINLYISGYDGVIVENYGDIALVQWCNGVKSIEWLANLKRI